MKFTRIFLVLSLILPISAFAQEESALTSTTEADYLMCRLQKAVRTIRIDQKNSGACVATYTKEGVDSVVGRSGTVDVCREVVGKIRTNLEKADWHCRSIPKGRISQSVDTP